ncbi:MAG TPA: heparinase II/III-family protein, partial [Pyrinomonadaceae bacterium]|nr:heparinase II/III-family protein [Pyrinomonadaceae bacterium]
AEPAETSKAFPEGGYFVMRDGWTTDSNYLLFDCGPHGSLACGHAHADALAFDLVANGRTMLVDPGTYTYTGSKELRDWFRGAFSHNTLTLDQLPSSLPAGPFSWSNQAKCTVNKWISNDRFDFVSGEHDGYANRYFSSTVRRSILFVKGNYWIVADELIGLEGHRAAVQFHFHPSARPFKRSDLVSEPESGFAIKCFGKDASWLEEDSWVSQCYGHKEPSKLCVFSALLEDPDDIVTFLLPSNGEIQREVAPLPAREGKVFAVSGGKTLDLVIIRDDRDEWVWLRFLNEHLQEGFSTQSGAEIDRSDPYLSELISIVKNYVRH